MNKIKYIVVVIVFSAILQSCLKDKQFLDVSDTQPVAEFTALGGVGSLPLNVKSQSYSITPPLVEYDTAIALQVASPQVLNHDVSITVKLDPVLIDSLNSANGSSYEFLPDSLFTVPSYTVTIPAGYRIGRLKINLKLADYDYINHSYAIGFTITNAPGLIISGNASSFVWTLDVKNQYDGKYSIKGYTLRAGDATRTGEFPANTMNLITAGSAALTFGALQPWADGTQVGIGNPELTINPDNSVTISSPAGAINNPGYNSYYDPSSQTFYISFTWGAGPSARLATDTLTYIGPR